MMYISVHSSSFSFCSFRMNASLRFGYIISLRPPMKTFKWIETYLYLFTLVTMRPFWSMTCRCTDKNRFRIENVQFINYQILWMRFFIHVTRVEIIISIIIIHNPTQPKVLKRKQQQQKKIFLLQYIQYNARRASFKSIHLNDCMVNICYNGIAKRTKCQTNIQWSSQWTN